MTLPTLVKNHQRQVYVTQLQKVVNELSQAAEKAINDNNAISLDETKYNGNNANGARNFFNDYFKVVKDCGTDLTPCFASNYKDLSGADITLRTPITVISLGSGSAISVYENLLGHDGDRSSHYNLALQVDVNGQQGPNIVGRDFFAMNLYGDGKIAENYYSDHQADYCEGNDLGYGVGCLTKIIQDGWKMDY